MQPHGGMQSALEVMGDNEGDMGLLAMSLGPTGAEQAHLRTMTRTDRSDDMDTDREAQQTVPRVLLPGEQEAERQAVDDAVQQYLISVLNRMAQAVPRQAPAPGERPSVVTTTVPHTAPAAGAVAATNDPLPPAPSPGTHDERRDAEPTPPPLPRLPPQHRPGLVPNMQGTTQGKSWEADGQQPGRLPDSEMEQAMDIQEQPESISTVPEAPEPEQGIAPRPHKRRGRGDSMPYCPVQRAQTGTGS